MHSICRDGEKRRVESMEKINIRAGPGKTLEDICSSLALFYGSGGQEKVHTISQATSYYEVEADA